MRKLLEGFSAGVASVFLTLNYLHSEKVILVIYYHTYYIMIHYDGSCFCSKSVKVQSISSASGSRAVIPGNPLSPP